MKILVFDVPAERGGALTVLHQFYQKAIEDTVNEWVFVVSTPQLEEKGHVKVINRPWVKKSWLHRLWFDYLFASRLSKQLKPDEVLSLQNILIPRIKVKQVVYMHQSLPFAEKKYKLRENHLLWVYQNLIGRLIFRSIKRADKVIVQTEWMRNQCAAMLKVQKEKIEVQAPTYSMKIEKKFEQERLLKEVLFFYPADGMDYKNHKVIFEAMKQLKKENIDQYRVVLTLSGDENKHVKALYQEARLHHLPVDFTGKLTQEQVFDYYTRSVLLFPSFIETYGLPMLEAKLHESPVIASDCLFSHEVLDGYAHAAFFNPERCDELKVLMEKYLK
ncbi:glycosyltransferase [Jeotgalibacillus salarius]|nr:glycosyltransferase [Jeotgalibacillus salarius]